MARPLLAGSPPTAPCSPPSCPAASHAKDNSNSPLGLSRGPLAIDGETGSPPSLLLSLDLLYPGLLPASLTSLLALSSRGSASVSETEGGQSPLKIPKMFTVSGAELQGSGLTGHCHRVRQALLTPPPPRPVRVEALVPLPPPKAQDQPQPATPDPAIRLLFDF